MAVDVQLRATLENLVDGNVDRVEALFQERTFGSSFKWTFRLAGAADGVGTWQVIDLSTLDIVGGRLLFIRADDTEATNASEVELIVNSNAPADGLSTGVIRFTRFIALDGTIQATRDDQATGIRFLALRARAGADLFRTVTLYLVGNSDFVGPL